MISVRLAVKATEKKEDAEEFDSPQRHREHGDSELKYLNPYSVISVSLW